MNTTDPAPTFRDKVNQFFFAEEIPYGLALLRILLPLILLEGVLARWRFSEELFSTNGVGISLWENFGWTNIIPPVSPFLTACLISMLVMTLVTSSIGWHTRFSLIVSLCLHTYFACNDVATSMTKFTVIATHVIFLLCMSDCGKIWSVDCWLAGRRNSGRAPLSERPQWALSAVWPQRLLLFMIGITYLGAAITKLHMPDFITGDAISYWIMSNPNFRSSIGEWMTQYPGLLVISGHLTVLWEILFVFLCWRGIPRMSMFGFGLFFHIMAVPTLGEVIFLMIMSACYLGCMTEAEATFAGKLLRRLWLRLPVGSVSAGISRAWRSISLPRPSPLAHSLAYYSLLLTVGLVGAWINYRLDLYGVRRPEGPYVLQPMDQSEVNRLFAPPQPIRETDKYLGVKVGSLLIGGRLSNRCDNFNYGDVIVCEASLNPPHEDMWMECHLVDSNRKIVNRDGVVVAREDRWAQFKYTLTEALEPGDYEVVIRSRHQEICRRPFTVAGGAKAASVN